MKELLQSLTGSLRKLADLANSPFLTMWLVVGMYGIKAVLKIGVGNYINSPMITGDGFHNLADIVEALAVLLVIWISRRPTSADYPFGQKNVEFFTSLAIGTTLIVLAAKFALQSVTGLVAIFPSVDAAVRGIVPLPAYHPLVMGTGAFWWVVSLTAGSVLTSFLVSRHQIRVGKKSGHASLIADGEETASDGRIELITLAGVLGEYLFHAPWLEYPLGLLVAGVIAHTGYGLFMGAFRVLLQHSIGADHEAEIRNRCLAIAGVDELASLKTFQIGSTAVCLATVVTEHNTSTITTIKYGLEHTVKEYILGADFKECELHLKFQKPEPKRYRIAFAVVSANGHMVVSPTVQEASHMMICDVEHGDIVRSKQEPKPADLTEFLKRKRVTCLYTFHSAPEAVAGVSVASSPSFQAHLVGLAPKAR